MPWLSAAAAAILLLGLAPAAAASDEAPAPAIGRPATAADLAGMVSIPPSGAGLPPGHGTAAEGQQVWSGACAMCHGDKLQGIKAVGAPALVGGRGTLTAAKPVKTVESYWPYATTLFDYVKRAMPFNAPGSLTDDQVYAVVAFILASDHVIAPDQPMDAVSLPQVRMPNATGFIPDPRPGAPTVIAAP